MFDVIIDVILSILISLIIGYRANLHNFETAIISLAIMCLFSK